MNNLISPSSPDSPPVHPDKVQSVYLMAIAGTGMGSFAILLKQNGYDVRGSDRVVWPPMSDLLRREKISYAEGFNKENLDPVPDLVIVGNMIRRDNPEAQFIRENRIPHLSFPEALGHFFLEKQKSVVVSGTHGKTTTTALISKILMNAGHDPSFLVGGMVLLESGDESKRNGASSRLGQGDYFVVEGDEYDTAYFDKGPKFLHYRPEIAVLTSVEFDHADIFRDTEHYQSAFINFLKLIPEGGHLAVCANDLAACFLADKYCFISSIETYSARHGIQADWQAADIDVSEEGTAFSIIRKGAFFERVFINTVGNHNIDNALAAASVCARIGLNASEIAEGLASFSGVARRQQILAKPGGVTVIDDFAHHPTSVRETVNAVRRRFPDRRLWAIFEPRSNTARRRLHQDKYAASFDRADFAIIATPPEHRDFLPEKERLDPFLLSEHISGRGPAAFYLPDHDEILSMIMEEAKSGDIVLIMSNGSFGGLHKKIIESLEKR